MGTRVKAVLFDIDGTILKSQGAGKRALEHAVTDLFGTTGAMDTVQFQGRTDPYIIHESLEPAGIARVEIARRMDEIKERYFSYLRRYIREVDVVLLPGIRDLLAVLGRESVIVTGLLTGNFVEGARIKLGVFDLFPLFQTGVFGDDTSVRNEMPAIARERIRALHGTAPDFGDMVVIGDTVHDVECGKRAGARTLAVGTGWTPADVLIAQGPDLYLDSLGDTRQALEGILRLLELQPGPPN